MGSSKELKRTDILPTCEFLELRPRDDQARRQLEALFFELTAEDNTKEERKQYFKSIVGGDNIFTCRQLRAWCKKLDQACLITESVVISEATPLTMLFSNAADRIKDCPERQPDSWREYAFASQWVLHYIQKALDSEEA